MKLTAALFFLACSSYAVATPISMVPGKVPRRADSFNSDLRQEPRMPIRVPIQTPEHRKVPEKKESKTQRIPSDNDRSLPSSHVIVSTSPKKPSRKPKSYLVRLVRRLKNKSPFSESSIVREETKASTEDWEPEATIVESETKASKEAYILIPSFSTNKTIHYRRVRLCTDMLVVSLALSVIAIIIIIELWKPVATRFRRYRSGHGPICLDDIEITNREGSIQEPCLSCGPMPEARFESNREISKDEAVKAK